MNRFTVALIIVADATLAFIDPASGESHATVATGAGMAWVP